MFDIGWTEMMVVAVVAILFVGPKDLPSMLRTFGQAVKKIRAMAGDFQRQFDNALKDAELDGVKDTINEVRNLNPANKLKESLNPIKEELDEAKKLVDKAADIDPETFFDESKAPPAPEPVKVDVEAALKRQNKVDAEKTTAKKPVKRKPAAKKTGAKSENAAKASSKKPASKRASATKTTSAKSSAARKTPARSQGKSTAKGKSAAKARV